MAQLNELAPTNQISSHFGQEAEEFAAVASSCWPYVFRFLLASLRDVDLAETLTQECLLKAHRHWSSFRGESNPRTWLIRIAANLQKDHWRNRRLQFWQRTKIHSVDLDDASNWLPSNESSPEEQASARERVRLIWRIVDNFPDRQRTVFLLVCGRSQDKRNCRGHRPQCGHGKGTPAPCALSRSSRTRNDK
jgi:RNA polymerase sigma-70 factor (ECF subfamily)